jgi:hypothetical protein
MVNAKIYKSHGFLEGPYIVNQFNVAPPALARATAFFDNFAYFAWELCTNNPTAQNIQNSLKNSSSADRATLN